MALDGSKVHTRFQHLLVQLQIEAGVLDRIVYRNKNQHRHGSYFQYLLKMTEPILKAAIQISLLLAKSFFLGFCITIMALLARLRVLVQQLMQIYREFHRPVHKRLVLECVWKGDKYLLLERTESTEDEIRDDIQEEETPCPPTDATNSSRDQVNDGKAPGEEKFAACTEAEIRNVPAELQTQSRRKVAFVLVKRSAAASNTNEPVKIPKLDLVSNDTLENDDPFLNLLFSGINTSCATNK